MFNGIFIMKNRLILLLLSISIVFSFTTCSDSVSTDPEEIPDDRGTLVEVTSTTIISKLTIQTILTLFGESANTDFVPDYEVELASIIYKTVDPRGNITEASGVVIYPRVSEEFPLLSWHHGTQTNRSNVGSESFYNAFDGIIAASLGYIVSEPDYLGLGVSQMLHPYHHEETSASSSIDMLKAAQEYCDENNIVYNDQLFLAGYSQGGYVTLAVQKELEANYSVEYPVTAAAPMAGAHDLMGTALFLVQNPEYDRPSFLSYLALAYNDVYQWNRLDDIFKSPYDEIVPGLYDGSLSTSEIDDELPNAVNLLFKENFLNGLVTGESDYFAEALINNSLLDWTPVAPITIIHGNADSFVPYENATTAQEALIHNGASYVDLFTIEGGDHGNSVLPAIEYTINWFNTFRIAGLKKVELVR